MKKEPALTEKEEEEALKSKHISQSNNCFSSKSKNGSGMRFYKTHSYFYIEVLLLLQSHF